MTVSVCLTHIIAHNVLQITFIWSFRITVLTMSFYSVFLLTVQPKTPDIFLRIQSYMTVSVCLTHFIAHNVHQISFIWNFRITVLTMSFYSVFLLAVQLKTPDIFLLKSFNIRLKKVEYDAEKHGLQTQQDICHNNPMCSTIHWIRLGENFSNYTIDLLNKTFHYLHTKLPI